MQGGDYVGGDCRAQLGAVPRTEPVRRECGVVSSYLHPFSPEAADEIGRLIERLRHREPAVREQWYSLCHAVDDSEHSLWTHLLDEIYVPRCRSAMECLARGDPGGFMMLGRSLGADLADAGLPFAVVVAHASFLKDGCARALADDPASLGEVLLVLEKPVSCLITAAADGYYRRVSDERWAEPSAGAPPAARDAGVGPTAGFFHDIVGRSDAMQRVYAQIARSAANTAPVLLLGETGTGKEPRGSRY